MIVGLPKEIKDNEYRVGLTPAGVRALTDAGHRVIVERSAGEGSGFEDELYKRAGATIIPSADDVWAVGSYGDAGHSQSWTLTEHWDGTQWSIVPSPSVAAGSLNAVTATAANDVWAVGAAGGSNLV